MPIYGGVFGSGNEVEATLFRSLNDAENAMCKVTTAQHSVDGLQENISDYKAKLDRVFEEDLKKELRPHK